MSPSPPPSPRIKFCGFTRAGDIDQALALGVDAIGLIFDAQSRRAVSPELGRRLRDRVPPFVQSVALFRNADPALVAQVIVQVEPDLLQFHGDETPDFCAGWQRPYIKAVPMAAPQDLPGWCARYAGARALLLDSHAPGALGGSGRRFDWSQAPRSLPKPWILAGGLGPENVAEAVRMARPAAVDVSSGIETAPGLKDPALMRAFVDAVRRAHPEPAFPIP